MWIISTKSSWRPVIKGTPQVSIQEPILFNIFINNLQGETEWTFSKFTGNAKLREVVDTPEGFVAIQKNLDKLEKRANSNLMKFNKGEVQSPAPVQE